MGTHLVNFLLPGEMTRECGKENEGKPARHGSPGLLERKQPVSQLRCKHAFTEGPFMKTPRGLFQTDIFFDFC